MRAQWTRGGSRCQILATLPKFVAEDAANPELSGFDCLDDIMAAE